MFRNSLILILSGLLVACGGGGGSDEPATGGQLSADQQRAKEILEHCASDAIDVLLGTLDAFAIVPGSTDLPIELLPIEGNLIPFEADIDGDLQNDLQGVISFLDTDGAPFLPFTQEQLNGGIDFRVLRPTGNQLMQLGPGIAHDLLGSGDYGPLRQLGTGFTHLAAQPINGR